MKISLFSRLLIAISGLLLVLAAAYAFLYMTGIYTVDVLQMIPQTAWKRAVCFGGVVLVAALGIFCISILLRSKRKNGGFVIRKSDFGEVSISIRAMENMVHHCVDAHKELTTKAIRISRARGGVCVDLQLLMQNGMNIPQTVSAMQREISEYLSKGSGVPVSEVRVMVETDGRAKGRNNIIEVAPLAAAAKETAKAETAEKSEAANVDSATAVSQETEQIGEAEAGQEGGDTAEAVFSETAQNNETEE